MQILVVRSEIEHMAKFVIIGDQVTLCCWSKNNYNKKFSNCIKNVKFISFSKKIETFCYNVKNFCYNYFSISNKGSLGLLYPLIVVVNGCIVVVGTDFKE